MADRGNILDELTNQQLVDRYRFNRAGLNYLETVFGPALEPATMRHKSLSAMDKLLITLRYLATGGIQLNDADMHNVSQPAVSKILTEVTNHLSSADVLGRFVRFPLTVWELDAQVQQLYGLAQFPKVVGVIDGTHIRIQAPSEHKPSFVNRKGFHSINVQVVFDGFDRITNVVARWPGSAHDSSILQQSGLRNLFDEGHVPNGQYHLLGDSGYAGRRWLLTPYLNPQPGSQTAYNRSHKITRAKVERGIGQLKRRFGVLHGEIRVQPEKSLQVLVICAVLHNICKARNIPMPDVIDDGGNANNMDNNIAPQHGMQYRDYFANTYF
ncbi:putative nuclease HARBI1 [Mya arenaria]|uniref:putative nuclease HARBI1 n=1 Tax=Mya arenaria TaxID=6604 RepID=UPI0022E0F02C|nr:putative nuclease HARBI1 [Mya arenaria]